MKIAPKTRNTAKRVIKRKTRVKPVKRVGHKSVFLRHLRLVEHKHTGKVLSRHHTSHLSLMFMLLVTGFFIYIGQQIAWATQQVAAGSVSIEVVVRGAPPAVGASITYPLTGVTLKDIKQLTVNGTCQPGSFVVVSDNDSLAGSTSCTPAGVFSLEIQLSSGQNILTAKNYDNINQSGPVTAAVTVSVELTVSVIDIPRPVLPDNPSIITGLTNDMFSDKPSVTGGVNSNVSSCDNYTAPAELKAGGESHVMVVCVPRIFDPVVSQKMGLLVWGGSPPYALRMDWGDSKDATLVSVPKPGYKTVKFQYASAGIYNIKVHLVDAKDSQSVVSTSVQVNGTQANPPTVTQIVTNALSSSWLDTPVPLYLTAVAITLGFWGGDIFDRKYGARYNSVGKHHAAH